MTGGGGKTPALLKKLYHIKTMKTRNLIKAVAVLSSIHVLAKMDYANLTMLDYILIVTAVLVFLATGYESWRDYHAERR